jgi:AcrR family transcriptional regulator
MSASLTRRQIIEAADQLFYFEGLAAVSMDRIAERAGVTKKTLYYHFRSKDALMGAYLEARHGQVMARYQAWAGTAGSAAERVERMFRRLAECAHERGWRGCGFVRAACELADRPGHPASLAARRHKVAFEQWLCDILRAEGRPDAQHIARSLMVLLDGAIVQALIHRDAAYAEAAADMACMLLDRTPRVDERLRADAA